MNNEYQLTYKQNMPEINPQYSQFQPINNNFPH